MTMQEIVEQADKDINYPFEQIIEKYLPWVDTVTDVVCTGIWLMEDVYQGEAMGPQRKQALMEILMMLWAMAPIPTWGKDLLTTIFHMSMEWLIDSLVNWLNSKFPDGILKAVEGES